MSRGSQIKNKFKILLFSVIIFFFSFNFSQSLTILGALNKVSGKISKIKVEDNEEFSFGTLKIIVSSCKKSLPEDPPENLAFVQIWDTKIDSDQTKIFNGWMFSSSPSISAVDHAVYDVWVIECMVSYIDE